MDASGAVLNGIGQAVQRKEDVRFLTGKGSYGDDLALPNLAHAVVVRSPHAHARIKSIGKDAAEKAPGVLAVLTGAEFIADGLKPIPHNPGVVGPPDVVVRLRMKAPIATADYPMPSDKVRFVGEAVVLVVAATIEQAKDAAELVEVQYEELPAVTLVRDAMKPGAPQLWDVAPGNLCVDIEVGDEQAADAAFKRAAHVVRLETWIQRVTGVTMETRTATGDYDAASGQYTLYAGTGSGVAAERVQLAHILGVPAEKVRCACKDMGGNFGTRNFFFPEYALLPWAARRIGRPVRWTCERREAFLSDYQGRDLTVEAELALDKDGNFLGLRGSNVSNLGAHAAAFVSLRKGLGLMSSVYRIPAGYFRGRGVVTNTVSTTPYRSAGRPEAIYVMERLVDLAARQCGFDPVELRRRNMIPPEAQPFANPLGLTYDNGRYREAMETVLNLADHAGFPGRRDEARRRGKHRGIGVSNYIEITSGNPRERTEITIRPEGKVELVMGTMNSGQGHETSFAQLVTEWLGVPFESIGYVAHDTARVVGGGGSHSGRSMKMATIVVGKATDEIIDKGRKIAAHLLEAGIEDIEFERGNFRVAGTDRELGIFAVAAAAATRKGSAAGTARAARRDLRSDHPARELPLRHADLRGRGRSRHRHGRSRALCRDRRCGARGQSAHPPRPDAWRHRPRRRSGDVGERALRPQERTDAGRDLHGLHHAAGGRAPLLRDRTERGARAVEPPGRALRRRRRHHARARGRDQRHRRRARRVRRHPCRDAGDARTRLARHPSGAQAGGGLGRRRPVSRPASPSVPIKSHRRVAFSSYAIDRAVVFSNSEGGCTVTRSPSRSFQSLGAPDVPQIGFVSRNRLRPPPRSACPSKSMQPHRSVAIFPLCH